MINTPPLLLTIRRNQSAIDFLSHFFPSFPSYYALYPDVSIQYTPASFTSRRSIIDTIDSLGINVSPHRLTHVPPTSPYPLFPLPFKASYQIYLDSARIILFRSSSKLLTKWFGSPRVEAVHGQVRKLRRMIIERDMII